MSLPTILKEVVFSFAYHRLSLSDLLATNKAYTGINDTTKASFEQMVATAYHKAFGRQAANNKFPLGFWNEIERQIISSCQLTMPRKGPFYFIYFFLKEMQGAPTS